MKIVIDCLKVFHNIFIPTLNAANNGDKPMKMQSQVLKVYLVF